LIILGFAIVALPACNTTPDTAEGREALDAECREALKAFKLVKGTEKLFASSAGYAVFPSVGKGAIGVGGAFGNGQLYEADAANGYCSLSQATIGLQLGGQSYRELIFFANADAVKDFKEGNFEFSAQASAVAVEAGASTTADYQNGVAVLTMSKAGLMFEASIGGQSFKYRPR